MLESVARAEDIVKVYEARLTEKETTSLSPGEVDDYILTLKVHFNTLSVFSCHVHNDFSSLFFWTTAPFT